jgi:hypothetical protein
MEVCEVRGEGAPINTESEKESMSKKEVMERGYGGGGRLMKI